MSASVVYVSLGSNIEPECHLVRAVRLLGQHGTRLHLSRVYQTAPQGFTEQADFLNMAVKMTTELSIDAFKREVLDKIETDLKRARDPKNKNAPRTIDLDISLWNSEILDYDGKHVPDKDILRFAHVALPLADLDPDYVHPETGQTLGQIAAQFDAREFRIRADLNFE